MEPILLFFVSLLHIIAINLLLSGDNAVVVAMASRNLPPHKRKWAIWWGTVGAVVLRILLSLIVVWLFHIPFIMLAGGVLLTWIAFKLLVQEASDAEVSAANSLWQAIQTIILADMVMSMDNVLAVAAAAKGDLLLLALGIAISIPIIIWGSTFILYLLGRFPWLLFVGGGILAWTAGEIIVRDEFVLNLLAQRPGYAQVVPIAATLAILIAGWSYNGMKRRFG